MQNEEIDFSCIKENMNFAVLNRWKGKALLRYNIPFFLIIVIAWEVHYTVQPLLMWKDLLAILYIIIQ